MRDCGDIAITSHFVSLFEDVFQEPIEEHKDSFPAHIKSPSRSANQVANKNFVLKDVNINLASKTDSPINFNFSNLNCDIQTPSPINLTPQSVEPLFPSCMEKVESDSEQFAAQPHNTESNSEYNNERTPMPSPCDAFSDFGEDADETLVPIATEDCDVTLTSSTQCNLEYEVNPLSVASEVPSNDCLDENLPSVASNTTSNDCSTFEGSETSTPRLSKRKSTKRCDKGRKRSIHVDDWINTKRKRLCNLGQEYTSRKGITKKAREMKASCNCRLQCARTFTEEIRSELFSNFWNTGSHAKQWQIVAKYVDQKNKKSCTDLENENNRRLHTLHYHLPIKSNVNDTTLKKVCKTMFLNTFNISKDFVYTALQKKIINTDFDDFIDGRGRHNNHTRVVTEDMKQTVIDHVNSYPAVESHYIRKDSRKKYLDSSLSFSKMFKMYSEWCVEKGYNSRVFSLRQYRDIVNTNLKIGFHIPKKDQCDLCHQFKNISVVTEEIKDKYLTHQKEKDYSRKLKLETKVLAANDCKKACIVFDFQKVLSSPHGNISIYYYKRKLNVYNFTVYDMASKEAFCYMWDETVAKRGPNEVASCIYDFMSKLVSKGAAEINFWSDNCGGQNRNRIVFYMYLLAANHFKIKIYHRFMEKGHTQNEGDSVHALIERTAKGKEIYVPDEWYSLVRWAKVNEKPYNVIEVKQDMILDFKKGLAGKNWTKNFSNQKVSWSKVKEIAVSSENEGILYYKYSLSDEVSQQIQCFKKISTRQARVEPLPGKVYTQYLPITKAKHDDLTYFCKNNIIPEKYHSFYNTLPKTSVNHESDSEDE